MSVRTAERDTRVLDTFPAQRPPSATSIPLAWWVIAQLTEYPQQYRMLVRKALAMSRDAGIYGLDQYDLELGSRELARKRSDHPYIHSFKPQHGYQRYYITSRSFLGMYECEQKRLNRLQNHIQHQLGDGPPFSFIAYLWYKQHGEVRPWEFFACSAFVAMHKLRSSMAKTDYEFEPSAGPRRRVAIRGEWDSGSRREKCGRSIPIDEVAW